MYVCMYVSTYVYMSVCHAEVQMGKRALILSREEILSQSVQKIFWPTEL